MHLFVLYLHPLLCQLKQVCGDDVIVAYADDVSAVVTNVEKLNEMRDLFMEFGRISGARLNEAKTTAIDIGPHDTSLVVPWLRTENQIKILGVVFSNSIREMVSLNWDPLVTKFGQQVWLHSLRSLSLHQKVTLLNVFLLSKIWYVAANLAPMAIHVAKLTSTMRSYLFRGVSTTVPMQQLSRSKVDGGLNLHLPAFKCTALLVNRFLHEIDSAPYYYSFLDHANSVPANAISQLPCLKQILNNIPDLPFQIRQNPSANLIYRFLVKRRDKPKVELANTNTDWKRVWRNISDRALPSHLRSELFMWVNQKVPHRRLLYVMRRTDGEQCTHCDELIETIQHKFFDCIRVRDAFGLLQQKLQALTGGRRTFRCADLLRPSLEWISTTTRRKVLKILMCYITFIQNCNDRIDVNELNFNLEVVV